MATGLCLKPGLDSRSDFYQDILAAVPAENPHVSVPNRRFDTSRADYETLAEDDYDLRLLIWEASDSDSTELIRFHVYSNSIAVVQAYLNCEKEMGAAALEAYSQKRTRELISEHRHEFNAVLEATQRSIQSRYVDRSKARTTDAEQRISWIARAIVVAEDEKSAGGLDALFAQWLANTARPDDAEKIIAGDIDFSMTWLNYVIVDTDPRRTRMLYSAMRIAQYFYASQEALNEQTQATISHTYFAKNIRDAESSLVDARARMQMLRIKYDIQQSLLNRRKRRIIEDIMRVWDFATLVENGARMVEVSSSRISEITTKRTERSSIVTDLILTLIALLAVVEVSLYMTEYSREVMSRPALEYHDRNLSWILSRVASIDTDTILVGGALSIVILVIVYAYWKIKK